MSAPPPSVHRASGWGYKPYQAQLGNFSCIKTRLLVRKAHIAGVFDPRPAKPQHRCTLADRDSSDHKPPFLCTPRVAGTSGRAPACCGVQAIFNTDLCPARAAVAVGNARLSKFSHLLGVLPCSAAKPLQQSQASPTDSADQACPQGPM